MAEEHTPTTDEPITTDDNEIMNDSNDDMEQEYQVEISEAQVAEHQSVPGFCYRALSMFAAPLLDESGGIMAVLAGLFSLFLVGTTIGLIMPKNQDLSTEWYRTTSACIGWIYFMCWSVSFYPQVISNFKRGTTQGLSAEFCGLNVLGFACYSIYNGAFFWNKTIHELYRERHGADAEISVQSNDVAFAFHALLLSAATLFQIGYYDGVRAMMPSKTILGILIALLCVCTFYPWLVVFNIGDHYNWLDYLYLLSTVKIMISLIKYIPQVILNYQRKSTAGWSIWNIILDFTGGLLSDLQLIFDCKDLHDFSAITGNFAKFGLGSVSIFFDIIFMLQHYVLYRQTSEAVDERQPLLSDEERNDA
ncbi:unnamed protein product [Cylindrotheca closterium]|uniref:Cystinosin n=1 Tax=Cylindrotheca closterium TaxID=2856 RepID=A0AAD2FKQ9_9STRA|nr:unnamed protein product [Cylindrotheca closterium]